MKVLHKYNSTCDLRSAITERTTHKSVNRNEANDIVVPTEKNTLYKDIHRVDFVIRFSFFFFFFVLFYVLWRVYEWNDVCCICDWIWGDHTSAYVEMPYQHQQSHSVWNNLCSSLIANSMGYLENSRWYSLTQTHTRWNTIYSIQAPSLRETPTQLNANIC